MIYCVGHNPLLVYLVLFNSLQSNEGIKSIPRIEQNVLPLILSPRHHNVDCKHRIQPHGLVKDDKLGVTTRCGQKEWVLMKFVVREAFQKKDLKS